MKKVTVLTLTAIAVCLLQACNSNKTNSDVTDDDTTNVAADTAKHAAIILDKGDIKFVTDVASACLAEIRMGNLAKQKGQDKRIKNLGAMTVRDVTKAETKLIILAKAKKITLPDTITAAQQKDIDALTKKAGKDFDNAYLAKTAADHKNAVELLQNEASHAYDPDIKAFAAKHMLPLKRHIEAIDAIHDSMK